MSKKYIKKEFHKLMSKHVTYLPWDHPQTYQGLIDSIKEYTEKYGTGCHAAIIREERLNIYKLGRLLKISDEDIFEKWYNLAHHRYIKNNENNRYSIHYIEPHKPPKQDNKTYYVGSGGSNCNKIRYPKKARKTAWKRFYKLFPSLKPEK